MGDGEVERSGLPGRSVPQGDAGPLAALEDAQTSVPNDSSTSQSVAQNAAAAPAMNATTDSEHNKCGDKSSKAASTSPHCFVVEDLSSSNPSIRVGRSELLIDMTGRELRVFRKSPRPPRKRTSNANAQFPTVALNAPEVASSPRCFDGHDCTTNASMGRVGRFELPNDVTGRKLRVFRRKAMLPFGSHAGPPVQRIAAETG
ncbi:hypothetical protein T484DRAFT_1787786 [Baffinella frigidus]|nr:hypothetical protein T484DRAFT_1787786 [Cryptophyta sp. CCMP2293]